MTKYNVGDKVTVRKDLIEEERYSMESGYTDAAVSEMVEMAGQEITISSIINDGYGDIWYYIDEDKGEWAWTDEMLVDEG